MSVRRLAEESVQPAEFAFNREFTAQAKVWIKKYPKGREQSAVIPLMMLAQEQDGWVTKRAIEKIADMLGMPYIRALEVATFYTQFQLKPVGTRAHVQVCGTTPCMLRGSEALMDVCRSKIHAEPLSLNESGTLSWEEVECQGACVNAPMVMIFKDSYEDLSPERLAYIIDRFEAGRPEEIRPGPQIDRVYSAPASGLTSLTEEIKPGKKSASKASASSAKSPEATRAGRPETPATETATKSPAEAKANVKADAKSAAKATAAPEMRDARKVPAGARATADTAAARKPVGGTKAIPAAALAGTTAKAGAKSASKPTLEDKNRPAGIAKPASPDDLKMISGVGPKIEGILHSLGIYTFAQVAAWKKAEREWVDGYLSFKGRIEREDWLNQAKALAKGGVAEYVKVFGKKPR
ncbi:NADH-quinone oxidoreductase, E subunit [Hoeflea sp. IMCC20628]|uniref:NADH-quinone oxidoreductase subunit E n=1 Tax=Hoeflea sp. IMCC20628 TaxID=1620421 RepID=UPI00063AB24D|nr:NADH-quinone oxidoreductase subunit E [Hoeflea sp. IMCC20628]AKI00368.1 NADH-quinone oxidoreductase, E subunit [Hoeflea sp. IMCC20628]